MHNSLPWMESTDAKLARAKVHLKAFQEAAAKYSEVARPEFIRKTNVEQTEHWLVFFVKEPNPPLELGAVIGDFLFNLRSALDSLVCGVVRKQNPTQSCDKNQFPIFDVPKSYKDVRPKHLADIPEDTRKLFDELQPFHRPDPHLDPLWILNRLCNIDKHRSIHLTLCYHRDVRLSIPLKDGRAIYVELPHNAHAGEVGTVPLPGHPDSVDDNVRVQIIGRTVLTFRDPEMMSERPVDEILTACLDYVEGWVLPKFKPLFA
jgi:hypothetical protein